MCGIAGFVSFDGHAREDADARVRRMTAAIAHRGPDGDGHYIDDHAALGHRRLAIIDVSGGHQPMGAAHGNVHIVFNGEIYNFLDMRAQLESLGHSFVTRCDTEVILNAYLEWGERCIERLNGMFAFAIWDRRSRSLLLARDRVGKKPLYYVRSGSRLAFASELKALRAGGCCPTEISARSLDCYLSFGYIPVPATIYEGVDKLAAAHCAVATPSSFVQRRYWDLRFAAPIDRPLEEAADELEALLDESVKCRLMSEVPLGAFLSGGLDSSLVVASMVKIMDRPVVTNSIGFDDPEVNELAVAGSIAAALGTEHHEFVVRPQAADVLEKIAWHFDEPLADSSAVPTWYVCEMARRTVTVALSGDGGDESFGGYTFRYLPHMLESRLRAVIPTPLRQGVFGSLGAIWPRSARLPAPLRLKTIFENLAVGDVRAYYQDLVWMRGEVRDALYSPGFKERLAGFMPMETVAPYYSRGGAPDALARSQQADIHFYMTDDVLVKVDRMSMAHSLEVRCPLLDHRILEFAARLPTRLKVHSRRGKVLLRALAARRLPAPVQGMAKRGFSIPAAKWLRGELRPMAHELLFDRNGLVANVLERGMLERLWREHASASRDHSVLLWGLMMLALWERTSRAPDARPN